MRIPVAPATAGARLFAGLFSAATTLVAATPAPALRGTEEPLGFVEHESSAFEVSEPGAVGEPERFACGESGRGAFEMLEPLAFGEAQATAQTGTPSGPTPGNSPSPTPAPAGTAKYQLLENRLTAREPFNNAAQKVRVVAFLAPSCPRCLANAGELQREVLAKNPDAGIAVIFVWLKVLDKDDEAAVAAAAARFNDPRVMHYWDPARLLNAQLLDAITFDVNLRLYDVFLLYDKKTVWEKRLPRPGYWMHEYKGAPGPWWNVTAFAAEVAKGLRGEAFTPPVE